MLYRMLFIILAAKSILHTNCNALPEPNANISDSQLDVLINLVFGSSVEKNIKNGTINSHSNSSEIFNAGGIKSHNNPTEDLYGRLTSTSSAEITSKHSADKREADSKLPTDNDVPSSDDDQGCICVPYDECDESNRTISQSLEGLIDERSRTCDSPLEVLCGCNSNKNFHQEQGYKDKNNNIGNSHSLLTKYSCSCQQETSSSNTHHSTHIGSHGTYSDGSNKYTNEGTSEEMDCKCQRKKTQSSVNHPHRGKHHGHKHDNKETAGSSHQQSEELYCICKNGPTQSITHWSYSQNQNSGDNIGSSHGSTGENEYTSATGSISSGSHSSSQAHSQSSTGTYDQHGYSSSNEGNKATSHQNIGGMSHEQQENYSGTDYNSGISNSYSNNAESHSYSQSQSSSSSSANANNFQGGHTQSNEDNTSILHHTTDATQHDKTKHTSSTSHSESKAESHSTKEKINDQKNHSTYEEDKAHSSHHTVDNTSNNNHEHNTGKYNTAETNSYSSSQAQSHSSEESLGHVDQSHSKGDSLTLGLHTTDGTNYDQDHTFASKGGSTTYTYTQFQAQEEAHSSTGTSYGQDVHHHNQTGSTVSSGKHENNNNNEYTSATGDTTNTGTTPSYSQSQAESHAHSSSYSKGEHSHSQGGTTSSDQNIGENNQAEHHHMAGAANIDSTSGSYSHSGSESHSSGETSHGHDKHSHEKAGSTSTSHESSEKNSYEQDSKKGTEGSSSTSTSNSYSQSHSSGGTSYNQGEHSHGNQESSTGSSHQQTEKNKSHDQNISGTKGDTATSSSYAHAESHSTGETSYGQVDHSMFEGGNTASIDHHFGTQGTSNTATTNSYSQAGSQSHTSAGSGSNYSAQSSHLEGSSLKQTNEEQHGQHENASGIKDSSTSHTHSSSGTDYGQVHSSGYNNSASYSNSEASSGSYGTSQTSSGSYGSSDESTYGHYDHANNKYNTSSNHLLGGDDYAGCGYQKDSDVAQRIKSDSPDSESLFGQFPWMVAILTKTKDTKDQSKTSSVFVCGGSLIHHQVVMTATHCIIRKDVKTLVVRAGEWNAQANDEVLPYQQEEVEKVIRHPDYYSGGLYNDVSLILIKKPFHFADNVDIICLPPPNYIIDYTEKCVVSGWGKESLEKSSKYQSILRQVELPLVPHQHCEDKLQKTRLGEKFKLHNSFICAGGEVNQDTCKGDGGGPLVCPIKGSVDRYQQLGIVSWGVGCGTETPAVYTNVKAFISWIDEQMHKFNLKPQYRY